MAIMTRLSRLLVSDMHSVLERMEEPELMLRQSIRDMEEALHARALRLQQDEAQLRRLERRAMELESRIAELDAQLDACISADRLDTARSIVKRKLEAQRTGAAMAHRMAELRERGVELREAVAREHVELDALREKARILTGNDDGGGTAAVDDESPAWVDEQDVEAALLREIERRSAP